MRRQVGDDLADWSLRQTNQAAPFPRVYPQMPPRFRRCCRWMRVGTLLELLFLLLFLLSVLGMCVLTLLKAEGTWPVLSGALAALPLWWGFRLVRLTPKFFWHCPSCGQPFPYYAPLLRGDVLREGDCQHEMEHLRIGYVRRKLCPLVVPSVCPRCREKFFQLSAPPGMDSPAR